MDARPLGDDVKIFASRVSLDHVKLTSHYVGISKLNGGECDVPNIFFFPYSIARSSTASCMAYIIEECTYVVIIYKYWATSYSKLSCVLVVLSLLPIQGESYLRVRDLEDCMVGL